MLEEWLFLNLVLGRALVHVVEGATDQNVAITVKLDNQFVADTAASVLAGGRSWPVRGSTLWQRVSSAQCLRKITGG